MMMAEATDAGRAALDRAGRQHIPVLLSEVLAALDPSRGGDYLDGTFGAGGYARAILDAGADRLLGLDRDPGAIAAGLNWRDVYKGRLTLCEARFSDLDTAAEEAGFTPLAGVVLDIGVSSMQIDNAERGFSFQKDGPLDMRMGDDDDSAEDLVNSAEEAVLLDILRKYGEERAARRIAAAIVEARAQSRITTTGRLAEIVAGVLPRQRPGQPHPATRTFQALRIAVNDELGELVAALSAAERGLAPGGVLAVVSFHSLEDRIVKRFFQIAAGRTPNPSRHAPARAEDTPRFEMIARKAWRASEAEIAANPRARSATLRAARRTDAPPAAVDPDALGLPRLRSERGSRR